MNAPLRIPPHSVEAEQWVIGGLLLDNSAWDRVATIITERDFYLDSHRRIFRHVVRLLDQSKPADLLTVSDAIECANETDQTGGIAYLGEIANAIPSAASIERHAGIVRDKADRRDLILAACMAEEDGWKPGNESAEERIDRAVGRLMALSEKRVTANEPARVADTLYSVVEEIEALYNGAKPTGKATGFTDLDSMTAGGLKPGQMVVVAGRPSMGKTAFALNIAEHVATHEGGVALVFSMEMESGELAKRNIASLGRVDLNRLMTGKMHDDDWDKMNLALQKLHGSNLIVDETGGLTLSQLRSRARRVLRKEGRLDLIVIDYLQLMEFDGNGENRNTELTAISRGIKAMAKELHCPVIALSQLSRKVEERTNKRPMISDLRESGAIEQDADLIVLLYREEYYKPDTDAKGIAEAIIGKQRNGQTGTVQLAFHGEYCRFDNLGEEFARRYRESMKPKAKGKGFADD